MNLVKKIKIINVHETEKKGVKSKRSIKHDKSDFNKGKCNLNAKI